MSYSAWSHRQGVILFLYGHTDEATVSARAERRVLNGYTESSSIGSGSGDLSVMTLTKSTHR